ncbi:hypothetical protein [Vibrio sp. F74]|uniref:hypothetical protein n=1 Tax=Vibrio sp. F74 TaxID=700020 RepID=UPI0035F5D2FE
MQNNMRTIWLALLTLTALLLSSVVSSTPLLMPIKMAVSNEMTMHLELTDDHCSPLQENTEIPEQACCDSDSNSSDHQCCPTSCVASGFSITTDSKYNYIQPSTLILFSKEASRRISSISNTLYKPPIA